jgi:hypothetical protein
MTAMKRYLKKSISHLLAILFFLVLVLIYFSPSFIDRKVIHQGDMINTTGMASEINRYYTEQGGITAWTNSMFSGMPAYQIYVHGNPPNFLSSLDAAIKAVDYMGASMALAGLIGFYILMSVMGVNRWLSIAGSIAFAFASYNFIIILVGHITKAYVIAYMPILIAGLWLIIRQRLLWGTILTTLGIAFSIMNSHMQITYYLALFCLFIYSGFLVRSVYRKELKGLWQKTGLMLLSVILAILPNIGSLYSNYEMSRESMRGPSELTPAATPTGTNTGTKSAPTGLDREYAFQWSYGRTELLTMLIPNIYGGKTGGTLDSTSKLYHTLKSHGAPVEKEFQTYTYWGGQRFTEGPVYFGALVCFLFLLGMFVIRSRMKWWIAGGALFFILLALGHNLAFFNHFLFDHLPYYNKFRAPSMALVIPGLAFPIIGMWGLKEIFSSKVSRKKLKRGLTVSLSICGGICLITWLTPGLLLDFRSPYDAGYQMPDWYYQALLQDRKWLASSDAFRSLMFIVLGAGLLYYFIKSKDKLQATTISSIGILLLILMDLWSVDKRYLNDSSFVSPRKMQESIRETPADKEILKDKDPSYRVLNLQGTFQESRTSFFHKSIGGYHAAKLRRYQELIDHRLSKEISDSIYPVLQKAQSLSDLEHCMAGAPSLNMLNARYVIFNPEQPPIKNACAMGNAWFVDQFRTVDNADEEIASLDVIDPRKEAVVDKRFAALLEGLNLLPDTAARIVLESYKPNELVYSSKTEREQLAVFSEIYYANGWKAFIDGQPAPHLRVDWILRGLRLPAGEHQIVFRFDPDIYNRANVIASVSSAAILALILLAAGYSFRKMRKQKEVKRNFK